MFLLPRIAVFVALVVSLSMAPGSSPARASTPCFAYVTNQLSDTVSVIDTTDNTIAATINVGVVPTGVAVTPDGTRVYVTNAADNTVSVIDTTDNTVAATINLAVSSSWVAVSPDGAHLYVTNSLSPIGKVSVINLATSPPVVVADPTVGDFPFGVAVSPDGTRAYVTNQASNTVSVIDTTDNTIAATIPVGVVPTGVAVTPDGTRAYVANDSDPSVSVIDTTNNTVSATILFDPSENNPFWVAVTPDGTRVYVTDDWSNNVSVIDTDTNTVAATINVGGTSRGVAVTPDGTGVYVTNPASNTVSVIDTNDNTVGATIPVGNSPYGVAVFCQTQPDPPVPPDPTTTIAPTTSVAPPPTTTPVSAPADLDLQLGFGVGATVRDNTAPVTITGRGLAPFADLLLVLRSDPRVIGASVTDASGNAEVVATVPPDTPAGVHSLTGESVDPDGNVVAATAWFSLDANGTVTAVSFTGPTPPPGAVVPGTPRFTG